MQSKLRGIVPAMVTPFTRAYALDTVKLQETIDWYVASGVHGISVSGSQGEFFALDRRERLGLVEAAVKAVDGRVPLYAGTGSVTTQESIELTRAAESAGADVAMVITPYFISPSAEELVTHYTAIARATRLPVMIYNNPPRTGVNITPEIFTRCLPLENFIGIKDSSGDMTQIADYIRLGGPGRIVFAGRDTIILSTLIHGGSGAISPAANVFPRLVAWLYELAAAGDFARAKEVSDLLAPLRVAWRLGSFPVVIKEAMELVGRDAGPTRPPIQPLSKSAREELVRVIERIAEAERSVERMSAA